MTGFITGVCVTAAAALFVALLVLAGGRCVPRGRWPGGFAGWGEVAEGVAERRHGVPARAPARGPAVKALTLHQPWASLVAAGVKTIETRSWPTKHRGPIAIHAGKRDGFMAAHYGRGTYDDADALWRLKLDMFDPRAPLADGEDAFEVIGTAPLGVIVATADLVDCMPIVDGDEPMAQHHRDHEQWVAVTPNTLTLSRRDGAGVAARSIHDQLPFGDYSPGRWAWLLTDIKPTTERCPWCWGAGRIDHPVPGVPRSVCQASTPCPVCWPRKPDGEQGFWADGRSGRCDPIPARGKQGLWEWKP